MSRRARPHTVDGSIPTTVGGKRLDTYVIVRRDCWPTVEGFHEAAVRATAAGGQMPDDIAWIRSYLLAEVDGSVGTVCIYQASSPEAIRRHATAAELPVDEIIAVPDTVIVSPDPVPTTT